MSFCGDEATQNNGNILGYILWKQIYCIFKWFYANVLGFKIEQIFLTFFLLGDFLGHFLKNCVICFLIFWSPWL
jgi:hypothetical protein